MSVQFSAASTFSGFFTVFFFLVFVVVVVCCCLLWGTFGVVYV